MTQVTSTHLLLKATCMTTPMLQVEEAERQKYPWCWRSPVTILIVAFLIALPLDCQRLKDKNLVQVDLAQ